MINEVVVIGPSQDIVKVMDDLDDETSKCSFSEIDDFLNGSLPKKTAVRSLHGADKLVYLVNCIKTKTKVPTAVIWCPSRESGPDIFEMLQESGYNGSKILITDYIDDDEHTIENQDFSIRTQDPNYAKKIAEYLPDCL